MSEAQQGPEICVQVISAKRYYFLFYFVNTQSEPLWEKEKCLIGPRIFSKLTPVIEFFSLSFCGVCKIKTINSMQEYLFESTLFAHK